MMSVYMVLPKATKMAVEAASWTPEEVAVKPFPVPPGMWAMGMALEANVDEEMLKKGCVE